MRLFQDILDAILPPICLSCQTSISRKRDSFLTLCSQCASIIPTFSHFSCPRCFHRLPTHRNSCHPEAHFSIGAATSFQSPPIRNLIHALKYRGFKSAFIPLSFFFLQFLSSLSFPCDLFTHETFVIPIPLHAQRERSRGFNQSLLFARTACDFFCDRFPSSLFTLQPTLLRRTRFTQPQSEIQDRNERFVNVASCFTLSSPQLISGKNIILIDDVFTSGATTQEAVRLFYAAGARSIIALVVARAT